MNILKADSEKTILLFNPVSGKGHLDSWCTLCASVLSDLGYRVQVLTPNSKPVRENLDRSIGQCANIQVEFLKWQKSSIQTVRSLLLVVVSRSKPVIRIILFLYSKLIQQRTKELVNETSTGTANPKIFSSILKKALKKVEHKPDLVINLYLDMYRTDNRVWDEFFSVTPYRIAGFRFVPSPEPTEGYLHFKNFGGLCLLEEAAVIRYQSVFERKEFQLLPDATNDDVYLGKCELLEEILLKASGRKIVFLGGAIGGNKNISCWSNIVENLNSSEWFFALVGKQDWSTFTDEDIRGIERAQLRENVFVYDHYVKDERILNLIISKSSLVFAVYRNFHGSSNMLAKSASFSVPIVVSGEFEMGRRVEKFGIGYCVEENNHLQIAAIIEQSSSMPIPQSFFDNYSNVHSRKAFSDGLADFVDRATSIKDPV